MADQVGYRVRLRVRIAKAFTTEASSLDAEIAGKSVSIISQNKGEPLSNAKWIILSARAFSTEEAAKRFGTHLSSMVQLAALASRLGVDVGENKPTSWVNENFARSMGLIKEHERISPNIHGLTILPDDDHTRIPVVNAEGTVTADPKQFTTALSELGEVKDFSLGLTERGVRLLNFAILTSEPLAQMVLAISAVEELGQNERWSEAQKTLIEQLAVMVDASVDLPENQRTEVAKSIRTGLFRLSLRQGVMRLFEHLGLEHLRGEWDRLYGIRSGIFHGSATFSDSEINQAASDTIKICGQVVLAKLASEGATIPSIAKTHF